MQIDPLSERNASAEAADVAGPEWQVRVLEPSPPANADPAWFADDPIGEIASDSAETHLLPHGVHARGTSSWSSWLADNPGRAQWVADRWLGGNRLLPPVPPGLSATRIDLHRLAAYIIAPTRHAVNGKFGLRWTLGGFGTPFFGDDRQVRVVGDQLVDQQSSGTRTVAITTLRAAMEFLDTNINEDAGAEPDSPPLGDIDGALQVDLASAQFLGSWFGMAFAALESVRSDSASVEPSRPQLWPGHFDPAIEVGDEDHRGSYGASPGDPAIDEPYLYVSVWWADRIGLDLTDPFWNAPSFPGAVLKLADFPAGDPVEIAADFFSTVRDRLNGV